MEIDKLKPSLFCEDCQKEIKKGYCWDCHQIFIVKWINETYLSPKYSEIMEEIVNLRDKIFEFSLEVKQLMGKLDRKKTC